MIEQTQDLHNLGIISRNNVGMGPKHFDKTINDTPKWTLFLAGPHTLYISYSNISLVLLCGAL